MNNTIGIYEERKKEIEFYFRIMEGIDRGEDIITTSDNSHFFKIMKSNLLLMLYNIVEACIVSGMEEIYSGLKDESCKYGELITEIQVVWSKYKINQIYGATTDRKTYENRVQDIIQNITTSSPIILTRDALGISGNLNAKKIKEICDSHKIRYRLETRGESLERVKRLRNGLAHGDMSFSECARDLTIADLNDIKIEVLTFLDGILKGMKDYYDNKKYKKNEEGSS